MALYVSKHWSVTEWDCLQRSRNEYAWDENGRLCTNDEKTANLFRLLDMLRDWNSNWVINTTNAGYKSGFRTIEVNLAVGGEPNSYLVAVQPTSIFRDRTILIPHWQIRSLLQLKHGALKISWGLVIMAIGFMWIPGATVAGGDECV